MKSLKARSSGPMSIACEGAVVAGPVVLSWLRMTERMACVPQAFWMVWLAKKGVSGVVGDGVVWYSPSGGALVVVVAFGDEDVEDVGGSVGRRYLNRKMTPYTGLSSGG